MRCIVCALYLRKGDIPPGTHYIYFFLLEEFSGINLGKSASWQLNFDNSLWICLIDDREI